MVPRLREVFRQGQAEVVSNSKNKILATWEPFFLPGPVQVHNVYETEVTNCDMTFWRDFGGDNC